MAMTFLSTLPATYLTVVAGPSLSLLKICVCICLYARRLIFICTIRLVLIGNESSIRRAAEKIMDSVDGVVGIEVVGLDMEEEKEGVYDEAVDKACKILGNLDALVHCYAYEGE